MCKTIGRLLDNVHKQAPLVHNITNYVTVNDCANILLACGASPIMADDMNEVEEITSICNGLNINIGTLNSRTIDSMILAGKKANKLNHPIILDPVGAGASTLRTKTANDLVKKIKFSVIRGNVSEIKTLATGCGSTKGVDADISDTVTKENLLESIEFAKAFAKKTGAVIAITGAIDIVANDKKAYVIYNGHPMMSKITGTGCMLTAMTAAFISANGDSVLEATASSLITMGLCGQMAYEKVVQNHGGNASYRNSLIDEVFNMTGDRLEKGANYEIY